MKRIKLQNLEGSFNVVSWKETGHAVHDAFPPAIVILLQNEDRGTFAEGQLVLLVSRVVVDGGHSLKEVLWHPVRNARHAA